LALLLDIIVQSKVSTDSVDGVRVGFGLRLAALSTIDTVVLQL